MSETSAIVIARGALGDHGPTFTFYVHLGTDLGELARAFVYKKENYAFLATPTNTYNLDEAKKTFPYASVPPLPVESTCGPVDYFILHTGMVVELIISTM